MADSFTANVCHLSAPAQAWPPGPDFFGAFSERPHADGPASASPSDWRTAAPSASLRESRSQAFAAGRLVEQFDYDSSAGANSRAFADLTKQQDDQWHHGCFVTVAGGEISVQDDHQRDEVSSWVLPIAAAGTGRPRWRWRVDPVAPHTCHLFSFDGFSGVDPPPASAGKGEEGSQAGRFLIVFEEKGTCANFVASCAAAREEASSLQASDSGSAADDDESWVRLVMASPYGSYDGASIPWGVVTGFDLGVWVRHRRSVINSELQRLEEAVTSGDAGSLKAFLAEVDSPSPVVGAQTAGDVERAVLKRFILCLPLDDEGNTAMHLACEFGDVAVVEELLIYCAATQANAETIAFALDAMARCVLAESVSEFDLACLRAFGLPCDINARTGVDWTPLHCACNAANLRAIKRLCQAGADASLVTGPGSSSPLHYLAKSDLFEAEPDDLKSSTAVGSLPEVREPDALASLRADKKKGSVFRKFFESFAPGDDESLPAEVLVNLQQAGNHIDATNSNGETPLQLACMAGLRRNVAMLLQQGSNVFSVSARGHTPLDYAEHRAGAAKEDPVVNLLRAMEKYLTGFLDMFPRTVFLEIFSYLAPNQLARCAMVCRVFRDVAYDNMLWERFVRTKITAPALGRYAAEFRTEQQNQSEFAKFPAARVGYDGQSWREIREPDRDQDFYFKIITLGDSGVGKSSLLCRFADDTYTDEFRYTIGVDFKIVKARFGGPAVDKLVKMQIWDTQGQERFRTIGGGYYRSAFGALFCYDVSDKDSWGNVKNWLGEFERYSRPGAARVVVGTKMDLLNEHERAVPIEEVLEFCEENDLWYCECSSKTGKGTSAAFARLMTLICENLMPDIDAGLNRDKLRKKRSREKCVLM